MLSNEYASSLSDGNRWRMTVKEGHNIPWLEKLAAIMELPEDTQPDASKLVLSMPRIDAAPFGIHPADTKKPSTEEKKRLHQGWDVVNFRNFRVWSLDALSDKVFESDLDNSEGHEIQIINMWNALQPIYQRSIVDRGLPFHAALIESEGRGVLLAARGDTGKSTCCRRLPDHWKPLCDDEALIVLDKRKNQYRVHPFPTWSDFLWKRGENSWNVHYSVPLHGVFFLEQSEIDEVEPVGEGQAAILINESSSQVCQKFWRSVEKKNEMRFRTEVFRNASKLARSVPAYRLRVSLRGKFWEKIEKAL
ncbi:MAG: SynChlorMet cassette protein ScmC, partial [Proteobacteria bacterium]|nr:SynChlorMet cassette protein ScmC [Pseudomonadota bacterium]